MTETEAALETAAPAASAARVQRLLVPLLGVIALLLWGALVALARVPWVENRASLLTLLAPHAPLSFAAPLDVATAPAGLAWLWIAVDFLADLALPLLAAFAISLVVVASPLPRALGAWVGMRGASGAAFGALLGVPLFECSTCSAPIAGALRERGASREASLGLVAGSALLNVFALVIAAWVLPPTVVVARVLFAAVFVLVAIPFAARVAWPAESRSADAPRPLAFVGGLAAPLLLGALVVGLVRFGVPTAAFSTGGIVAIFAAALVGTLLAVPALFEIPLALAATAAGAPIGAVAALFVTAPSVSLVTFLLLRRDLGDRSAGSALAATFVLGAACGLVVEGVSRLG
ncbi:MAG: hypothetical protein ACYDCK_13985 [Thermoplasmatota archaeon]